MYLPNVYIVLGLFVLSTASFTASATPDKSRIQHAVLSDFDSGNPSILSFNTSKVIPAPVRSNESKSEYNKKVKQLGDLIYDHTKIPNLVVSSGKIGLLEDKDLIRYSGKNLSTYLTDKELLKGEDISVNKNYICMSLEDIPALFKILSVSSTKLEILWLKQQKGNLTFSRQLLTDFEKQAAERITVVGKTTLYSLQTDNANTIKLPKLAPTKLDKITRDLSVTANISKTLNIINAKSDIVYIHKPKSQLAFPFGKVVLIGFGRLSDFAMTDLARRINLKTNNTTLDAAPNAVYLLKNKNDKYTLFRVLEVEHEKTLIHWVFQPSGAAIFPVIPGESAIQQTKNRSELIDELFLAVKQANSNDVLRLLKEGVPLDVLGVFGTSVLQEAIMKGNIETIKILLKAGAKIDQKSSYGWDALHTAIRTRRLDIVQLLVENGAKLDVKTPEGETPLSLASHKLFGNEQIQKYILEHGATADTIFTAAQTGNIEYIQEEFKKGINLNEKNVEGKTAFHLAAESGKISIIKLLIDAGADLTIAGDKGEGTALDIAARFGRGEIVKLLVENPDVSEKEKNTALYIATENGQLEAADTMLKLGVDAKRKEKSFISPYDAAMRYGRTELVDVYRDNGYEVPIWVAARLGDVDLINQKILQGENINTSQTSIGETALELAIKSGQEEAAKVLIEHGADVNKASNNFEKNSQLHYAIETASANMVRQMLNNGANINAINSYGRTPLYEAVVKNKLDLVEVLLDKGASYNILPNGVRSLHGAVVSDEMKKLLTDRGIP